ncbi:hypothetical protein [Streptomyces chattanoogensis]|uniref:hypothetical protein n=1 Tax=Streptomyces chattanoogensis TaxID=66876 RepID=UPI00367C445C
MASSPLRGTGLGRFLLAVVVVVLALPVVAGRSYGGYGSYGQTRGAALSGAASGAPSESEYGTADGRGAAAATPVALDLHEHHPQAGPDRCRPRRGGRSAAAVSAPPPLSTPLSTACPVRDTDGPPGSVPLTGQRAVPLSRSGELPVQHRVFRC